VRLLTGGVLAGASLPPFGLLILLGFILYTRFYHHTDRSVLGAVLLHFSGNASGTLLMDLHSQAVRHN